MVAHLHPRSRSTLSLFTTCLTISFLVVGAPHIFPCPVDGRQYSEDGSVLTTTTTGEQGKRRRKRKSVSSDTDAEQGGDEGEGEGDVVRRPGRECPVPKPGGLIGQVMGFEKRERRVPTTVLVEKMREERRDGEVNK